MRVAEAYSQARGSCCCVHGTERDVRTHQRDISRYLGTTDPLKIGAARLLELAGYERTHVQLSLFMAAAGKDGEGK